MIAVRFPTALAILEGTWTTRDTGVPTGPIVYGERGTLVLRGHEGPDGRYLEFVEVYTSGRQRPGDPDRTEPGDPLPKGRATLAEEFIHHLETGEPLHLILSVEHNLAAMAILDAGLRSCHTGKLELVDDAMWCVG